MSEERFYENYTIEKHLRKLSEIDEDYEILYSIWELNKKNLSRGLSSISSFYPQYSIHDFSHSSTLLNNIQCVLGEDRIKRLGATDSFLLLMSCLTHDIGMILTYDIVEKEWKKTDFIHTLEYLATSNDHVIKESAELLLKLNTGKPNTESRDGFKWALEVKNAVVVLTAEVFRNNHPKQSAEYLTSNEEFKRLADNFYFEQLPKRFMELLANIAFLHGQDFDTVISSLYYSANGMKDDYIHPRFIACMLRLGDLLDFDSNRFDEYAQASLKDMPDVSLLHKQKHSSVTHMLISPTAIEAELDCPTEAVYRVARSWFDWLETEVNFQSREWTSIAPKNLGGLPPVIGKDSIKILYQGIKERSELLNLKFTMSQNKMFQILQGGGIYKEPGFAFIREIVQNAFDASKLQMWKDYENGIYSYYGNSKDKILFPEDIDPRIYNQYPVKLSIKWKNENKDILHVECQDFGTGISEAVLIRMTQFVGESRIKDPGYIDEYANMPNWLKPTAAFGIGLQSVFFVAPTFDVETNFIGEVPKRIQFRSPSNGQYSFISQKNITRSRGTTVMVDIPKQRFSELFGSSCDWNILENIDIMSTNGDNVYLAKIDSFVRHTFSNEQSHNCFIYESENIDRSFSVVLDDITSEVCIEQNDYRCRCVENLGFLVFNISETEFGSSMEIWFNSQCEADALYQRVFLRGVLISNASLNYYVDSYLGIDWNLYNQTTDMIVDLSRDNLTYKGKKWMTENFPNHVLPNVLEVISKTFEQRLEDNLGNYGIQYLNFALTAFSCKKDNLLNMELLKQVQFPDNISSRGGERSKLNSNAFFEAESVLLIDSFKRVRGVDFIKEKEKLENDYSEKLAGNILIWSDVYLHAALVTRFICTEVLVCNQDCVILKLEKIKDDNTFQLAKLDPEHNYLRRLDEANIWGTSRNLIMGFSDYADIVVKRHYVSGYEKFPVYSNCFIYSPFPKKYDIKKFVKRMKTIDHGEKDAFIKHQLDEFLTPTLIKDIIDFNLKEGMTESHIKDCYLRLIMDFVNLYKD